MTSLNKPQIITKINKIGFSDGSMAIERVSDIIIHDKDVGFSLDITSLQLKEAESIKKEIINQLNTIPDIGKISIVLTSSKKSSTSDTKEKSKIMIEGVDRVIVVAAGKGGVGKSTISALLAHKLASEGKKVGIIDADIYGPSIPKIFGLKGKPTLENNRMLPLENYGILINSIGFLTDPTSSVSWRGPMTSKALYQLLSLTHWGKLDYLIIDTPPGTGDIHLSLLQNYDVHRVLMVTTPQVIAELDVSRTINLYKKFNIPIVGIIENMSYFIDPQTNKSINIFAGNSGEVLSKKHILPLVKIPIIPALSEACDLGTDLSQFVPLLNIQLNLL